MQEKKFIEVPIWHRYALTVEEAAAYFHIGTGKLRQIVNDNPDAEYLLRVNTRTLFKREKFEKTLDMLQAV